MKTFLCKIGLHDWHIDCVLVHRGVVWFYVCSRCKKTESAKDREWYSRGINELFHIK